MKALPIEVYVGKLIGDCSNNGVSSKFNELLLIHDEGFIDIDENNIPDNLVKVVSRDLIDGEYKHIQPYKEKEKGTVGYMFGGNYASTSDSRFSRISKYPLPIHDRVETPEQYEALSR